MKNKFLLCLALFLLAGCAPGVSSDISSGAGEIGPGTELDLTFDVRADWSRLEGERPAPQPDMDGGRWYPEFTTSLIPSTDYGPLVPYRGVMAYPFSRWETESGEIQKHWSGWSQPFYGLMTREGKIVVDPVYQDAYSYSYRRQGESQSLPVLILSRSGPEWAETGGKRYAVAAEDGSWITDFEFLNYNNRDGQLLLISLQGMTRLDSATGERTDWVWEELGVREEDVSETLDLIQWVFGLTWTDHGILTGLEQEESDNPYESSRFRIFQPETGEISWVGYEQWDEWYSEYSAQRWSQNWEVTQEGDRVTISREGEIYVIPDVSPDCWSAEVRSGLAILNTGSGDQLRRLSNGELLLEGARIRFVPDDVHPERPGCVSVYNDTYTNCTVYDASLTPLLSLPQSGENSWLSFSLRDSLLSCYDDSTWFGCWDLDAGRYVFYRNLYAGD